MSLLPRDAATSHIRLGVEPRNMCDDTSHGFHVGTVGGTHSAFRSMNYIIPVAPRSAPANKELLVDSYHVATCASVKRCTDAAAFGAHPFLEVAEIWFGRCRVEDLVLCYSLRFYQQHYNFCGLHGL